MGWRDWFKKTEPGNTIFDDDRLKMQALAEVMKEEEEKVRQLEHQELLAVLSKQVEEIKVRRAAEHVRLCAKCNSVAADAVVLKNGQALCQNCFASPSTKVPPRMVAKPLPPKSQDLITTLMTDLDYIEKGDVTKDELDYVRRSVLGEEGHEADDRPEREVR